jgi:uncharacterized protein (DUF427 family)
MAVDLTESFFERIGELRYAPTRKRIRAVLGGEVIADTTAALLAWEPQRVVPLYAVPDADVRGEVAPGEVASQGQAADAAMLAGRRVRAVGEFASHTTPGESLVLRTAHGDVPAFRPADPVFAAHVILDFDGVDTWLEEDEEIFSHPRDPYHRVDVRQSSRRVRIERDGEVLAESSAPRLVFETNLPTRHYLPREDVREDLLRSSATTTACPYKGHASYFSVAVGDRVVPDLAWIYEDPLPDAAELGGLVAFFDERVDVVLDGERQERPQTPWSRED